MAFTGARVTRTTDFAVAQSTNVPVVFDSEVRDDEDYHDNATNPTRLTVPADGVYYIAATVEWEAAFLGRLTLRFIVNGTTVIYNNDGNGSDIAGTLPHSGSTTYPLNAGDYVELEVAHTAAGSYDLITTGNFGPPVFTIIRLDDDVTSFEGAHVYRDTNKSITLNTDTPIDFNQETQDDNSYHDNVTNNTRLTVPADGWYIFGGQAVWQSTAAGTKRLEWMRLNGTTALAMQAGDDLSGENRRWVVDTAYYLSSGDYIEFCVWADASITVYQGTDWALRAWILRGA